MLMLSIAIVVLSLVGLWNAFYFTFAYYGRVRKARWIPEILCAREGSSCVTVVQTPYARVFGVPNSLLGIFYYSILILWVALGSPRTWSFVGLQNFPVFHSPSQLLIFVAAFTVGLGFYLIYALIAKLHTHCPLCYAGHAINAVLLVLLILASFR
jgi:uncharacterized membrane protein